LQGGATENTGKKTVLHLEIDLCGELLIEVTGVVRLKPITDHRLLPTDD
jgi:hypothetical protein